MIATILRILGSKALISIAIALIEIVVKRTDNDIDDKILKALKEVEDLEFD